MDTLGLITALTGIFTGDPGFLAWCQHADNLGERPTLFVGVDDANPPGAGSYPLVGITAITTAGEVVRGQADYIIDIGFGVKSEALDYDEALKVYTYKGFLLAEAFRVAGLAALKRAALGKFVVEGTGQADYHPLYVSGMRLAVSVITTGRGGK